MKDVASLILLTTVILNAETALPKIVIILQGNLEAMRIEQPTAIQSAGNPSILEGKNVALKSYTGSGKVSSLINGAPSHACILRVSVSPCQAAGLLAQDL